MRTTDPPLTDEPVEEPAPHRRRVGPLARLLGFMLAILLLFGGFAGYALKASSGSREGREVTVIIKPGASASTIAAQLERAGVIDAAWLFRLYARLRGSAGQLKPGEYVLRTNMSYGAVFEVLEKGPKVELTRVTVPEGKTVRETAEIFQRVARIPASEFMAIATGGSKRVSILPPGSKNLEGLLFPKTYDLKKEATAAEVVELLLEQFEKETAVLDWSRARALGITPYQTVIIASMIEREARVAQDRPKISAVMHNRLRRGMRLEIDATVQYGIYLTTGSYKHPLLLEDYQFRSPYNTYLILGLPPAPIASPGLASLQAALHPAAGRWLYYVLINDKGEHGFANTYQEFLRLKAQAQRNRSS